MRSAVPLIAREPALRKLRRMLVVEAVSGDALAAWWVLCSGWRSTVTGERRGWEYGEGFSLTAPQRHCFNLPVAVRDMG